MAFPAECCRIHLTFIKYILVLYIKLSKVATSQITLENHQYLLEDLNDQEDPPLPVKRKLDIYNKQIVIPLYIITLRLNFTPRPKETGMESWSIQHRYRPYGPPCACWPNWHTGMVSFTCIWLRALETHLSVQIRQQGGFAVTLGTI